MHGRIEGVHLLRCHIFRVDKGRLIDGANERKGGIQNEGGLRRLVHILVGVAQRDGAHSRGETATHARHTKRCKEAECERLHRVVAPGRSPIVAVGMDIEAHQQRNQRYAQQDEIPVAQHLFAHNARDVPFMAELAEHRHRRAPTGVLEIDCITEVHHHREGIDEEEKSFGRSLPYRLPLPGEWQEHEQRIERIGVEDGGSVEKKCARPSLYLVQLRKVRSIGAPVFPQEHHTAEGVEEIHPRQIDEKSQRERPRAGANLNLLHNRLWFLVEESPMCRTEGRN